MSINQANMQMILFLYGSSKSLQVTFEILNKFYYYSGLKENLSKIQAVWLGRRPKKKFRGVIFDLTYV